MSLLSAGEVFQTAVRIEENGERFYRKFTEKLSGDREKEIFTFLADEEVKHAETFRKMLEKVDEYELPTSYPDEYYAYLRTYADNLIFTQDSLEKEVSKIIDAIKACEFGIQRELDAILYYQEIKSFVPDREKELINSIIGEERKHFLKLSQLKKEL